MDDDAVWLKVDDSNRADFEARGMGPFFPFGDRGPVMHYWQLPEDVLEDVEQLRRWCDKAIAIAAVKKPKPAKKAAKPPAKKPRR
jgi:DNA transformation protein and related proteins